MPKGSVTGDVGATEATAGPDAVAVAVTLREPGRHVAGRETFMRAAWKKTVS
jgi:hypothetical protein